MCFLLLIKVYCDRGYLFFIINLICEWCDWKLNVNFEDFGLSDSDFDMVFFAGWEIGFENVILC